MSRASERVGPGSVATIRANWHVGAVKTRGLGSGRGKEGTRRAARRGEKVMGGEAFSVPDMNEPCSGTEALLSRFAPSSCYNSRLFS